MNITGYQAKYYAYELTKRCSSNSIEKLASALHDAQVDLNPHQVEAALFAFKSPLSKGAILADEVGLGKTIEAGIVLSQKWAERKRKILIIVPSNLRKQWNIELLDKFFLPSVILESKSFNQYIKEGFVNPFEQDSIVICSYNFIKNKKEYAGLINWDLVVIDEAHRLRNVYKPSNKIANSIKESLASSPKILLTATPLQNSLLELYGLVSFIDDYTFGDIKSFKERFSRLETNKKENYDDLKSRLNPICKRTLRRQVLEYIKFTNRIPITQEFYPTEKEQILYDYVSEYLQRDNLMALPKSQRHLMTLILRKLLASSTFAISGTLNSLVNKLKAMLKEARVNEANDDYFEDYEAFDETKEEWEDEEGLENRSYTDDEISAIKKEIEDLEKFRDLAESITHNAKGQVLLTALNKGFIKLGELGAKQKAIIFTESRRTQQYLYSILSNTEYTDKLVLFNGTNNDEHSEEICKEWLDKNKGTDRITGSKTADKRGAIIDYFRDTASIMIATEAAAEGVNLQFCSLVVNYDMPWNPQRIEQRIGRCHRYGQKFDVVVVNFLNKNNAADQRVYELLSEKFKLFEGVFGASDEVLGSIESGVDFEKRINQIYQECRTPGEIQSSFDQLQREMEGEINEKLNNTRQKLLENFDEEVHEKLKVNLKQSQESLNKYEKWLIDITKYKLKGYADFFETANSFTLLKNPYKTEDISLGTYKLGRGIEDAHIYRIGHPLAQNIISDCKNIKLGTSEILFDYTNHPSRISIIEPLLSKRGEMAVWNVSVDSLDDEDHIILTGVADDGSLVDEEQCRRLLGIEGKVIKENIKINNMANMEKIFEFQKENILNEIALKNSKYFDEEMEKLEKWAEDIKSSLEIELRELDIEIKTKKTEAKKILKLEDKVRAQREIKDLERRRNNLRMNLYNAQDEIDDKKDKLIEDIEKRLKQKVTVEKLFVMRWAVI